MPQPLETHTDVLFRIGMMGMPGLSETMARPVPIDGVFSDQMDGMIGTLDGGHDATGMAAANLTEGGTVISGPAAGGAFLDRPMGDFLAHSSNMQSLDITVPQHGMAETIRAVEGYSHLNVGGVDIDLLDYVPGGDAVQLMAGQRADPSGLAMMIAKHGMVHESGMFSGRGRDHGGGLGGTGESALVRGAEAVPETDIFGREMAGGENDGVGRRGSGEARAPGYGPDSDVLERDRGILLEEHSHNLETSVASFDQSVVHTEMHAHGRTIAVDTHFEAHHPDNEHEKRVADNHVHDEVLHAPRDETTTERPGMRFRTLIHAQLDAASKDEGLSI